MIAIGNDHAGYELKVHIRKYLEEKGFAVRDVGCDSPASVDYAVYGEAAAREVADGRAEFAVIICGTGLGISMAANKIRGIRAALCTNEYMASMARRHNDANVLALGARVVGTGLAESIVDAFLTAKFEGGRHAARVQRVMDIENRQ